MAWVCIVIRGVSQGDCYQKWGQALLGKLENLSNEDLTIEAERRAHKRAEALYQNAVDAYKEVNKMEWWGFGGWNMAHICFWSVICA